MRARRSASTPGEGVSSATFWWRRCTEQSRSPSATTRPSASPRICTSTWRARSTNRSRNTAASPKNRSARVRAVSYAVRSAASSRATLMPIPPPPPAAFTITG